MLLTKQMVIRRVVLWDRKRRYICVVCWQSNTCLVKSVALWKIKHHHPAMFTFAVQFLLLSKACFWCVLVKYCFLFEIRSCLFFCVCICVCVCEWLRTKMHKSGFGQQLKALLLKLPDHESDKLSISCSLQDLERETKPSPWGTRKSRPHVSQRWDLFQLCSVSSSHPRFMLCLYFASSVACWT